MAKVWIVESGSYSDYGVDAVCSTKENAQKIADWLNGESKYKEAEVAERELDPIVWELDAGKRQYLVRLNLETGAVVELSEGGYRSISDSREDAMKDAKGNLYTRVWATDEAHAIKVAGERRARFKADPANAK